MFWKTPFHKPHTKNRDKMALNKTRRRRDSFGLEVRRDGTLAFDFEWESLQGAAVTPVTRKAQNERGTATGSRGSTIGHSAEPRKPEPRKSVSVPKARRRRDSFGLEVRADGTLSLDQLVRDSREPKALGNSGRAGVEQPGVERTNGMADGRSRSMATLQSARRDSDQSTSGNPTSNTHHPQNGRLHPPALSTFDSQPATVQRATEISGRTSTTSESRRSQHGMNNDVDPETVGPDNSEVRMLRERVRRLEVVLAQQNRSSNQGGDETEMPPAYESRPSSPAP